MPSTPTAALLLAATAPLCLLNAACPAQVLTTRAALEAILTDQIEIEDFEFISLHIGGILTAPNPLSDATAPTWGVTPIPTYSSDGELQLYATFIAGDDSIILRGTDGMRIDFDPPQAAAGFTLFGSTGSTKIVRYFSYANELGSHTLESGFTGYDATDTALTSITITNIATNGFIVIDDMTFGLDYQCPADVNKDGVVNFFDMSEFISLFLDEDELADINQDGLWNFFDVSDFVTIFTTGCPQ